MAARLRLAGTILLGAAIGLLALVPFASNQASGITPTPSNTFTPTRTPLPPTHTPTPLYSPLGDANCDNEVTSADAAIILQLVSGLLDRTPCPLRADVNRDGAIASIDAALVLQYSAGLLSGLPTPTQTFTPTLTRTPTPTVTPYAIVLGAEFTIEMDVDGDGTADCTTREAGHKQCVLSADGDLTARLSLDALPAGGSYAGYNAIFDDQGLFFLGRPESVWPECLFVGQAIGPGVPLNFGCGIDIGVSESTYTGPLAVITFRASCDASLSLGHGPYKTSLWNRRGADLYVEAMDGEETLELPCADGFTPMPLPTVTPTQTPTTTPTLTPCPKSGCPTPTPSV